MQLVTRRMHRDLQKTADEFVRQYGSRAPQKLVDLLVVAVKAGNEAAVERHDKVLRIVEAKLNAGKPVSAGDQQT